MKKLKGVYSRNETKGSNEFIEPFAIGTASSCRIESESGTVYWLSAPEEDGYRSVVREPPRNAATGTMIVQPPTADQEHVEIKDRFRGRLRSDVQVGMSLALDIFGSKTRILSEVVVRIERGNVPDEIFQ